MNVYICACGDQSQCQVSTFHLILGRTTDSVVQLASKHLLPHLPVVLCLASYADAEELNS